MVDYHKNNPDTYNTRSVKILCIENNKTYNSIGEASKELGLKHIGDCIHGFRDNDHGYHFKLLEGYLSPVRGKKVMCIETKEVFNSIREAESVKKCCHIYNVCKGDPKRKTAGGYHWMFID